VAGNSVIAAILVTGGNIVVGVTTGSLGILSEAEHSALDLFAACGVNLDLAQAEQRLADLPLG
jgi:divalent metal cation (Fe/Co/Zn/Cd) transporter